VVPLKTLVWSAIVTTGNKAKTKIDLSIYQCIRIIVAMSDLIGFKEKQSSLLLHQTNNNL